QVWERLLGPASGTGIDYKKVYKLDVKIASEMFVNDDQTVTVSLVDVPDDYVADDKLRVLIKASSASLKVEPEKGMSISVKNGRSASFLVSASTAGNKTLRIADHGWLADAPGIYEDPGATSAPDAVIPRMIGSPDMRDFSIKVLERPMFMF